MVVLGGGAVAYERSTPLSEAKALPHSLPGWEHRLRVLARIAGGQTHRLTSGATSPLEGAEQQILHSSPLKRGRDPGSETICLPPCYPGKGCTPG